MKATILNVDDTEIARYAKRRTLEHAGFEVVDVPSGQEALDELAARSLPLVLLDVRLPDMSGIEVCQIIKQRWPSTMVLQTSATFTTAADRARGLQGGADAYLVQPIDADELVASVRALLRLHTAEEVTRGLNAMLEQRIAERTHELNEVNRQLREEIAQRQQAEAALVQAQKMEVVGQLTGTMAHDFNNILASMTGYIHVLRRMNPEPQQRGMLDKALASAERGKRLTARLLAFSRSDGLATGPVAIGTVVAGMREWLAQSAGSSVALSVEVPPQDLMAMTDENQFEMAVLNLVVNARDAMPQGGSVVIRVELRTLPEPEGDLAAGDYVLVSVRDSGVGMRPEVAERAFDAFFTTKPLGHGTGLGLAQVQRLAKLSQGEARLVTAPGEGTDVQLWLAKAHDETRIGAPAPDLDVRGHGERLLVIDDEADIRRTMAELLQEQGYQVVTAASGEEGLRLLPEEKPAMLLLDFTMPGMSGLEVARRVKHLQPGLPVIFITAFPDRAWLGSQFPQHCIIAKPFNSDELFMAIAQGLQSRPSA